MSRVSTGTVQFVGGVWKVRVTDPVTKARPWIDIPGVEPGDIETAKAIGTLIATKYRTSGAVAVTTGETVNEWTDRWFDARPQAYVSIERCRWNKYVAPKIGTLAMKAVAPTHCEGLVESLDAEIRAGNVSWKTIANVWSLVTKAFDDACHTKDKTLRILSIDPTDKVRPPDRGAWKAKAYLYPSELLQLVACSALPMRWRQLYAISVYLYARRSELESLKRSDVDLAHGLVHFHSSADEEGEAGEMKTAHQVQASVARQVPIPPTLVPLLEWLCKGLAEDDALLVLPHKSELSLKLKEHLKRAGVTRRALFASDKTRKNITYHDLRATGITWCAVRGDDPLRIKQRAGHSNFKTTEKYIREAENLLEGNFGTPFPELPSELWEAGG